MKLAYSDLQAPPPDEDDKIFIRDTDNITLPDKSTLQNSLAGIRKPGFSIITIYTLDTRDQFY